MKDISEPRSAHASPGAVAPLAVLSLFSVVLVVARIGYAGNMAYAFMLWNLFLAWIPLCLSVWLRRSFGGRKRPAPLFWIALVPWLFFYPNAPYLLTDIVHLADYSAVYGNISIWFDFFLVLFFGVAGLLVGFYAMQTVRRMITAWFGRPAAALFLYASTLLCAVGLCLGRFLRWNSWDLFLRPFDVLADAMGIGGGSLVRMLAFIGLFFIFLLLVYKVLIRLDGEGKV